MTDKLKKRVRARMAQTGESYQAALNALRTQEAKREQSCVHCGSPPGVHEGCPALSNGNACEYEER